MSGERMPFIHVGDAAASVMAGARGNNILLFPQETDITKEKVISRSAITLEMARDSLLSVCGVTGTTRMIILMIEEMVESNSDAIIASDNLSKKISRLAKVFTEETAP
jgi:hypothetical protein